MIDWTKKTVWQTMESDKLILVWAWICFYYDVYDWAIQLCNIWTSSSWISNIQVFGVLVSSHEIEILFVQLIYAKFVRHFLFITLAYLHYPVGHFFKHGMLTDFYWCFSTFMELTVMCIFIHSFFLFIPLFLIYLEHLGLKYYSNRAQSFNVLQIGQAIN